MTKTSTLKILSVISALYQVGDIDSKKKNSLLNLVVKEDTVSINKELYKIREISSCRTLIDGYLQTKEEGGRCYAEN